MSCLCDKIKSAETRLKPIAQSVSEIHKNHLRSLFVVIASFMLVSGAGCTLTDDICPDDPDKDWPGICGCGIPDYDEDEDGYVTCRDHCDKDSNKTFYIDKEDGIYYQEEESGKIKTEKPIYNPQTDPAIQNPNLCGCGKSEEDSDEDGVPDCIDTCDEDASKNFYMVKKVYYRLYDPTKDELEPENIDNNLMVEIYNPSTDEIRKHPNQCGCGQLETDTDNDGVADCNDECKDNPIYTKEPKCGDFCDEPDRDQDGTADCEDLCPDDSRKNAPGKCGCGIDDSAYPSCDECLDDPDKYGPGICGCGHPDIDTDGDTVLDCLDICPTNSMKKTQEDIQLCSCNYYDKTEDIADDDECNDRDHDCGNDH